MPLQSVTLAANRISAHCSEQEGATQILFTYYTQSLPQSRGNSHYEFLDEEVNQIPTTTQISTPWGIRVVTDAVNRRYRRHAALPQNARTNAKPVDFRKIPTSGSKLPKSRVGPPKLAQARTSHTATKLQSKRYRHYVIRKKTAVPKRNGETITSFTQEDTT